MKNMNKKGWIKIVEASIASLVVIGFVIVILSRQQTTTGNVSKDIHEKQNEIFNIISRNESLRVSVLDNDKMTINNTIAKMMPGSWDFATSICNINEICSGDIPLDREVYSSETIISSTLTKYEPKKLKFFVWVK